MGSQQTPAVTLSTTDRDRQEKNATEIAQKMGAVMKGFDSITKWVALSKMIARETSSVPEEFAPGILNQINQAAIMEHQNIKSEK